MSWSYSLLTIPEQRLLRRLSCFHEGFPLDALEQACYGEDERFQAVDHLESLVEKGLARVVGSEGRFALLETIRAFAAEQLHAGGETEAARDAHAAYSESFAARLAQRFRTPEQLAALRAARADDANLHAALHRRVAQARAGDEAALERGLLLAGHLDWFWHVNGQRLTARVALDALLRLAAGLPPSRGRALASLAAGMVATVTGEWERSLGEWTAGFEDGEAVGDALAAAEGRMGMGYCLLSLGRPDEAAAALDDAIARSRGGDDFMLALSMTIKGMVLFVTRDLSGGMALVEEALAAGERERAARCFREAVRTNDAVGSARGTGLALMGLAAWRAVPHRVGAVPAAIRS